MANPTKVLSEVVSIEAYGDGVYLVTFAVPSRSTRFLPGQFLHLALDEFDPSSGFWPESRVFSIASQPRLDKVCLVYSVKGSYTKRMEAELVVGRQVWLKFPYGSFVIDEACLANGPVVLVAGGTGVSPYRPFLLKQPAFSGRVHLFYGARRPEHILFLEELKTLSATPWFHLHLSLEEGSIQGVPATGGRLSIQKVEAVLGGDALRANYYLSGPPGMIKTFQKDLLSRGVREEQIHTDEWE